MLNGKVYEDLRPAQTIVEVGTAEARSHVPPITVVGGAPATHRDLSGDAIAAASSDARVAGVLRVLGTADLGWVNLGRILDTVNTSLGGRGAGWREIVASGLATDGEIRRFSASANNPSVGGDDARHGDLGHQPVSPSSVMTIGEAESLVRRVVTAWLARL